MDAPLLDLTCKARVKTSGVVMTLEYVAASNDPVDIRMTPDEAEKLARELLASAQAVKARGPIAIGDGASSRAAP